MVGVKLCYLGSSHLRGFGASSLYVASVNCDGSYLPKRPKWHFAVSAFPGTQRRRRFPLFVCAHLCGLSGDARRTLCRLVLPSSKFCRFLLSVLCFVAFLHGKAPEGKFPCRGYCVLRGRSSPCCPLLLFLHTQPQLSVMKTQAKTKLHSTLRVLNPKLQEYVHPGHPRRATTTPAYCTPMLACNKPKQWNLCHLGTQQHGPAQQ